MIDYREILRLHSLGTIKAAKAAGVSCPLDDNVTNADIQEILFPGKYETASPYTLPDNEWIHRELAKNGVTLTLLWGEYCTKVRNEGGIPYMYTQFCEK
ncbi:MAG: IS21 family transposase, partial [Syntrophomonadaceae bacterium]